MCVLIDVPTQQQLDEFQPIKVFVAPEGCKRLPVNVNNANDLIQRGWIERSISTCLERTERIGGCLLGRRKQYGLRHRIASTIHAAMGQDLDHLVTRVSLSDAKYKLWEKEQVVVLLSRTHYAKDIHFVGEARETANALASLLGTSSQYSEYMCHILERLCHLTETELPNRIVDQTLHPFCPADVEIPSDISGFCYILISLQDMTSTYIGETRNLIRRLREHNSGLGSKQTASQFKRPWALLAYVVGFDSDDISRQNFEREWEVLRDNVRLQRGPMLSPMGTAELALNIIQRRSRDTNHKEQLRYVKCGDFVNSGETTLR